MGILNLKSELPKVLHNDHATLSTLPNLLNKRAFSSLLFDLSGATFFDGAQLTHLRCLFDLAKMRGINIYLHYPEDLGALRYSKGMGLYKGFISGDENLFFNGQKNFFIPLTRIASDKNDFLYHEFSKIFNLKGLSASPLNNICVAFTELADNIFYHSGDFDNTGWGYLQAQLLTQKIKISFTDTGVGFLGAYKRSGTDRGRNPTQLLIDSFKVLESRLNKPGKKAIRGIGLHEVQELLSLTSGHLTIRSNTGMIKIIGKNDPIVIPMVWDFLGTQISMEIPI